MKALKYLFEVAVDMGGDSNTEVTVIASSIDEAMKKVMDVRNNAQGGEIVLVRKIATIDIE